MRCECCDKALSSREATRKFPSGVYVDMCDYCLSTIDTPTLDSSVDEEYTGEPEED